MAKVRVGLVGYGFVAELHMYAYKRVYGSMRDAYRAAASSSLEIASSASRPMPRSIRRQMSNPSSQTSSVIPWR
jgi:hypothetical protein